MYNLPAFTTDFGLCPSYANPTLSLKQCIRERDGVGPGISMICDLCLAVTLIRSIIVEESGWAPSRRLSIATLGGLRISTPSLEQNSWVTDSRCVGQGSCRFLSNSNVQGGSNMTGTDLCVNKPHCAAAVRPWESEATTSTLPPARVTTYSVLSGSC